MFGFYENQPLSPGVSSYDMEPIDEIPSPSLTSQLSISDQLTTSNRVNSATLHNSVLLRFKVSLN